MTTRRSPLAAALMVLAGCGDIVTEPRAAAESKFDGTVSVTLDSAVAHAYDGEVADSLGLCAPDRDQCAVDSIHVVMDGDKRFQVRWTPPPLALADSLEWRYRLYFAGPGDPHYVHYVWVIHGDAATTPRNRLGCRRQEIMDFARRVEVRPEVVVKGTNYRRVHKSDRGARRVHRWRIAEWLDPLDESECTKSTAVVVDTAAVLDQIAKACGGGWLDPDGRQYAVEPEYYPSGVLSGMTMTWSPMMEENTCTPTGVHLVAYDIVSRVDGVTGVVVFGGGWDGNNALVVSMRCPPNAIRFTLYAAVLDLTYIQNDPFALITIPRRQIANRVIECTGG